MPDVELTLHPQQTRAVCSRANELLFGGAAGGGKSFVLRAAAIQWATSITGLQIYLFRRLFPDLEKNHMEGPSGFPALLAPLSNAGKCSVTRGRVEFSNGSKIFLCHCQHERDLLKYQGTEMHVILLDELTHFTQSMYRFLRGRCRMTGINLPIKFYGLFPRIMAGTNPGSIGHHWVKETWVDRDPYTVYKMNKEEGGMRRVFIPSRMEDNPTLLREDPGYLERLEGLGDALLVRALKDGDWDVVAGSMFGDVWRKNRHVCRPFAIPMHWRIWRGGDDGFVAPAAVHWLTEDPELGTVYVIREVYGPGMLPDTIAEKVKRVDRSIPLIGPFNEHETNTTILEGIMDASAFMESGQADQNGNKVPSRGAQMNAKGCRWKPAAKPPGSRIQRAQNMHRMLAPNPLDPEGRPGLIFFDCCTNAIKTIPTLPRDPSTPEDVWTDADDHCFVSGTMITTPTGDRAIETLRAGDMVLTRKGARLVLGNHGGRIAETYTLNGRLKGTGNHPIWTLENGWVRLDSLTPSVTLWTWTQQLSAQRFRNSKVFDITFADGISNTTVCDFTKWFGSMQTDRSHTTTTYTTMMKTERTTHSQIYGACPEWIMESCTDRKPRRPNDWPEDQTSPTLHLETQSSRIKSALMPHEKVGRKPSRATVNARYAEGHSHHLNRQLRCAALLADKETCVCDVVHSGKAEVFNLTVDGEHEYFANGILVANCYDSVCYGLQAKKGGFRKAKIKGV